jgi:copper chaperone NosL
MRRIAALVVLAVLAAGCANAASATGPPDIVFGRDLCVECGMLITEARFASGYRVDGDTRTFDDIGNMLLYGTSHGELDNASTNAWVHDYEQSVWIAADSAWYVLAPGLVTPMGWGLVAFADEERAVAFAAEREGELHRWPELFEFSMEQGRLVHRHDGDHEDDVP